MTEINKAPYTDAEFEAFIAEWRDDVCTLQDCMIALATDEYSEGMLLTEEEGIRWRARDEAHCANVARLTEIVRGICRENDTLRAELRDIKRAISIKNEAEGTTQAQMIALNETNTAAVVQALHGLASTVRMLEASTILAHMRPVVA